MMYHSILWLPGTYHWNSWLWTPMTQADADWNVERLLWLSSVDDREPGSILALGNKRKRSDRAKPHSISVNP